MDRQNKLSTAVWYQNVFYGVILLTNHKSRLYIQARETQGGKYDLRKYTVRIHFVFPNIWASTKLGWRNKKCEAFALWRNFPLSYCGVAIYTACPLDKMASLLEFYKGKRMHIKYSGFLTQSPSVTSSSAFPGGVCVPPLLAWVCYLQTGSCAKEGRYRPSSVGKNLCRF